MVTSHLELLALTLDDDELVKYVGQNDTPEIRKQLLTSLNLQRMYCLRGCNAYKIIYRQSCGVVEYSSAETCILNAEYRCYHGVMTHKETGKGVLESIRLADEKEQVRVKND